MGPELQSGLQDFEQYLERDVIDKVGTHSKLSGGMHGQKLDIEKVQDERYAQLIDLTEQYVRDQYNPLPDILIGVANGANRIALDTARRFGGEIIGFASSKHEETKKLYLPERTLSSLKKLQPKLVVVVEDVSTTGSNSIQVATEVLEAGAQDVQVLTIWQRRERLEHLEGKIVHKALINKPLPTYTEQECAELTQGFCKRGWKLKKHKSRR